MDAEITQLEERLASLIESHAALRAENRALADRVGVLETENRNLADKVQRAVVRLEVLLERVPEAEDE